MKSPTQNEQTILVEKPLSPDVSKQSLESINSVLEELCQCQLPPTQE